MPKIPMLENQHLPPVGRGGAGTAGLAGSLHLLDPAAMSSASGQEAQSLYRSQQAAGRSAEILGKMAGSAGKGELAMASALNTLGGMIQKSIKETKKLEKEKEAQKAAQAAKKKAGGSKTPEQVQHAVQEAEVTLASLSADANAEGQIGVGRAIDAERAAFSGYGQLLATQKQVERHRQKLDDFVGSVVASCGRGDFSSPDKLEAWGRASEAVYAGFNGAVDAGVMGFKEAQASVVSFNQRAKQAKAEASGDLLRKEVVENPAALLDAHENPERNPDLAMHLARQTPAERAGLLRQAKSNERARQDEARREASLWKDIDKEKADRAMSLLPDEYVWAGDSGQFGRIEHLAAALQAAGKKKQAKQALARAKLTEDVFHAMGELDTMPLGQRLEMVDRHKPKEGEADNGFKLGLWQRTRERVKLGMEAMLRDPAAHTNQAAARRVAAARREGIVQKGDNEQALLYRGNLALQEKLGVPASERRGLSLADAAELKESFLKGDPQARAQFVSELQKRHGSQASRVLREMDLEPAALFPAQLAMSAGRDFKALALAKDLWQATELKKSDVDLPDPDRERIKSQTLEILRDHDLGRFWLAKGALSGGDWRVGQFSRGLKDMFEKFAFGQAAKGKNPQASLSEAVELIAGHFPTLTDPDLAVVTLRPGANARRVARQLEKARGDVPADFFKGTPRARELWEAATRVGVWVNQGPGEDFVLVHPANGARFVNAKGAAIVTHLYGGKSQTPDPEVKQ